MSPEPRYHQSACQSCEAADAICAAYRHALKDIVRGEEKDAKRVAIIALDNDKVNYLGRLFHKVVKAAVIITKHWTDQESTDFNTSLSELQSAVEEIRRNPGATVRGWVGVK